MALNKLREFSDGSFGVVIPKDDLRLDGLLDDDGDLAGEQHAHVRREEDGGWSIEIVEDL